MIVLGAQRMIGDIKYQSYETQFNHKKIHIKENYRNDEKPQIRIYNYNRVDDHAHDCLRLQERESEGLQNTGQGHR